MAGRILLVDDELESLEPLMRHLRAAGYEVLTAQDADWALYHLRTASPGLVILDICFASRQRLGLDILKEIRVGLGDRTTPVLMLTGVGEEELEPLSFDLGATDFVRKSVSTRALLARIRARLPQPSGEPLAIDERLRIDMKAAEVHVQHLGQWQIIPLEAKQLELLIKLVLNPGQILPRERLEDLFDDAEDPARALNICICRLRDLIEVDPHDPHYIQTKRGIGYKFHDYR